VSGSLQAGLPTEGRWKSAETDSLRSKTEIGHPGVVPACTIIL
jgi:hypothetical protein